MGMKEALTTSLDMIAPVIDERTTLLIDLPISDGNGGTKTYTFGALFVGGKWYVTGQDRILSTCYDTTIGLLTALARYAGTKVEIVTETEVMR